MTLFPGIVGKTPPLRYLFTEIPVSDIDHLDAIFQIFKTIQFNYAHPDISYYPSASRFFTQLSIALNYLEEQRRSLQIRAMTGAKSELPSQLKALEEARAAAKPAPTQLSAASSSAPPESQEICFYTVDKNQKDKYKFPNEAIDVASSHILMALFPDIVGQKDPFQYLFDLIPAATLDQLDKLSLFFYTLKTECVGECHGLLDGFREKLNIAIELIEGQKKSLLIRATEARFATQSQTSL